MFTLSVGRMGEILTAAGCRKLSYASAGWSPQLNCPKLTRNGRELNLFPVMSLVGVAASEGRFDFYSFELY